jgi:hypothetical protein
VVQLLSQEMYCLQEIDLYLSFIVSPSILRDLILLGAVTTPSSGSILLGFFINYIVTVEIVVYLL